MERKGWFRFIMGHMAYLFEVTARCPHKAKMDMAGNALDVKALVFACSECGTPANVNYAEEVGLDPSDPNSEKRIQELTAGFSSQSFYIGTVADGQLRLEPRMRKQIVIVFAVYCNTCKKQLAVNDKLRETVKAEHGGHDVQVGPVGDVELTGAVRELFLKAMEDFFGEPVQAGDK